MPTPPNPPASPDGVFALFLDSVENNEIIESRNQGFRIAIRAKVKSGFRDADVFRYQKISSDEALFTGICSPADIADYTDIPSDKDGMFRADRFDLVFASQIQAYETRDEILAELETLCCEMARIANSTSPTTTLEVSSGGPQ